MIFRQALSDERDLLFKEGYKEWPKGRSFEQYCADNAKEDGYGKRFVLERDGEILSSLILLTLADIAGLNAYGIGSVLTPKIHAGKGYATALISSCMKQEIQEDTYLFLFSDINPAFYERFNFRTLPSDFQKYEKSVFMVYCSDHNWNTLIKCPSDVFPAYF